MKFQDPSNMTLEQILEEIHHLRDDVRKTALRIFDLSRVLRTRVRRRPSDEFTGAYLLAANAWNRFSGMLEQGLRRASSSDRVLQQLIGKTEVEKPSKGQEPSKAPNVVTPSLGFPRELSELFGSEMTHAVR